MERHTETRIRYLNIDEMFLRIDKLRTERELFEAQAAQSTDFVAQFEGWAAAESTAAAWMQTAETPQLQNRSTRTERFSDPAYVWMGDDMAVHLEAADPSELDIDTDTEFDRNPAQREPWRDAPPGFLAKWGLERYALGVTAVGIIALIIAGTALRTGPNDMMSRSMAMANLSAGRDPYNEVATEENVVAMPGDQVEVAAVAPRRQSPTPDEMDERVHQALADQGFWDIGVSAGSHGDVYLAGDVYSTDDVNYVIAVARHAAHAANVFFLHPDVLSAQGPAYFGAAADYAPAVWGAKISYVAIGSPAYMAGVRAGDVIRGFDGKMVADADDLQKAVSAHQPGQRIQIRVWRDDANQFLVVRLSTKPRTEVAMR
jgi:PDZ domain